MNSAELDSWLELSGLMPPMPHDVAQKIQPLLGTNASGKHTYLPSILTRNDYYEAILPQLQNIVDPELLTFINQRVESTFAIRNKLKMLKNQIISIVGEGNFSALWLDREAFSADSMEHRALVTEAVIHVYSPKALQSIVQLLYQHRIPMIPYGEGGGYNMGVTPMAPAVTISVRGIDHISQIQQSRRTPGKYEVSVGAGVPFKDLVGYLSKRGYVLRCDPNTPRAATGGIAATGSNGGRKAFEVILHGRAIAAQGTAVCFAADAEETECINNEPFLLARKFFSITNMSRFQKTWHSIEMARLKACRTPNSKGIVVPLQGMKAAANMKAQQALQKNSTNNSKDTMANSPTLPISAFVGAEGCTGFIYEVTFEIEKPLPWLQGSRWHFASVEAAMAATRAIKTLPKTEQPEYFEFISGHSIRRYLLQDFPSVFSEKDEAVIIFAVEGDSKDLCEKRHNLNETILYHSLSKLGLKQEEAILKVTKTSSLLQSKGIEEFEILRKPREELPKKLRTKCKTDMEIRTEYLGEVLKIVEHAQPRETSIQKQDVLFGHLTPNHTAIIHWNIGGFDLYDEEQADIAWDYLENVIGKAQNLAPATDRHGSARFTGEHGVAGKAPFLWLNYIPTDDFSRMCSIKDTLDPNNLFNPETLFLRTSHSRALRARLLNTSAQFIKNALQNNSLTLNNDLNLDQSLDPQIQRLTGEHFAIAEGQKCTRCNSCKVCPVIDAEHELERERKRRSKVSVLPSKRNILMFMEYIAHARKTAEQTQNSSALLRVINATSSMMKESAALLSKCFYCRKCDKACPVDIEMHPLMRAYHQMGMLPSMGSKLWGFVYERLMGEDVFKSITYKVLAFIMMLSSPILKFVRKIKFIPDWLKTYTVPPTLSLTHYEPSQHGTRHHAEDNFVVIATNNAHNKYVAHDQLDTQTVYIRYRGCMDTFGNPQASTSVDTFFKDTLHARFVDLEKKMCCGFPFEADGLHERAKQSQIISLIEIAKCIFKLIEEHRASMTAIPHFVVFSNCPTCCEAIREMCALLKNESIVETVRIRSRIPEDFDMKQITFHVQDTAEIAVNLINKMDAAVAVPFTKPQDKILKTVGLKVPCHNTKAATDAQLQLLKMYYKSVAAYDRCCGLSGTGRLKHPKIGTKISEKLFEQIREEPAEVVVSGCPSCRDGVTMQRDILQGKKDKIAKFHVAGIFEQIINDKK